MNPNNHRACTVEQAILEADQCLDRFNAILAKHEGLADSLAAKLYCMACGGRVDLNNHEASAASFAVGAAINRTLAEVLTLHRRRPADRGGSGQRPANPIANARPIPDCPGYFATTDGHIISARRQQPTQLIEHLDHGCLSVAVRSRSGKPTKRCVHMLVLQAFAGPCPTGHVPFHINGNSTDNRPANLKWVSRNERYQIRSAAMMNRSQNVAGATGGGKHE